MRQQRGGAAAAAATKKRLNMLDKAKQLMTPSRRSDVPPFMVMDVMAAAARIEAAGGRVIHMEVGQPAASAPATAIAAARTALADGRLGYTEALGIPSLRQRIARHYGENTASRSIPAASSSPPDRRRASSLPSWRCSSMARGWRWPIPAIRPIATSSRRSAARRC
jgi:hypothetical protein